MFFIFGILIFSSVSFVSAQEPGAGFTLSDFLKVSIGAKGSTTILDDIQNKCSGSCAAKYNPPSDKWSECLNVCADRSGASEFIPSLALCEYISEKAEKKELDSYVTTESKTPYEIYNEMESRKDYSSIPFNKFDEYQTQFPQGITYDKEKIIRGGRYSECLSKLLSLSEGGGLCSQCEIEVGAAKEECYYQCQNPGEALTPSSTEDKLNNNGKTDTATYVPEGSSNTVYIKEYKGEVLIKDINGDVKPLTGKIALVGDGITLITKDTGKVLLIFNDGSHVELGSNSQFYVGNSEKESILDFGKIKAKIIKCFLLNRCYPTRFPNAAVSIRGTEYIAIVDQYSNTTTILVNEGTVSLTETKTGSTQNVSEGKSGVVDSTGIKLNSISDIEWKNATKEFDLEKDSNQWIIYFGILLVLFVIGFVIYKKMKKKDYSEILKRQGVGRKSEKNSGETKRWGIASLILAILSILFLVLPFVGIILAILAIIFARIQKKHNPIGIATAGLVIGIISIIFNIVLLIAG